MIRYINAFLLFPLLEIKAKRSIQPKLAELKKFAALDIAQQEQLRREELFKILLFSKVNVTFYKDLFKSISFDENKILKDIRYIEDLPILTKAIIRENSANLRLPSAVHPRKTGGSTGQSVFFYYDDKGLDWTAAINLLAYEMAGNFPYRKDCHIASELGIEAPGWKGQFLDWLKLFSQNRKRLMINSFSDEDLAVTFNNLKTIKPYLLQGHPSSGYAIANYIKEHGLGNRKYCSVFEPSGEMLTPKVIQAIEENLGCKVVNRYGNAEFGVMAHTRPLDPYNKLQIFNRAFYIEEAQQSNIIVTNFTNYSFPLFRYDTGDIATIRNEPDGSFIYDIQGRVHDLVRINNEDYPTHFLMDYLDHKVRQVREFQILIQDDSLPIICIVPESDDDKERISKMVQARWPEGLEIRFAKLEDLQKVGWQKKFRHVIDLRGING